MMEISNSNFFSQSCDTVDLINRMFSRRCHFYPICTNDPLSPETQPLKQCLGCSCNCWQFSSPARNETPDVFFTPSAGELRISELAIV